MQLEELNLFSLSIRLLTQGKREEICIWCFFYYIRHQINETCEATSVSEHTNDEIQPLATLFTFAAAPEAFYISVKLGVYVVEEGVLDHRVGMKAKPS